MADYTYSEIMKMQNDAIKRVEEMQKKARQTAGLEKEEIRYAEKSPSEPPRRVPMPNDYLDDLKEYASKLSSSEDNEANRENVREDNSNQENKKMFPVKTENFFGDLIIDEDKALLLSLILLLSEEKGDELLIMALIYMLT